MVAGSATTMDASDLFTTSTQHIIKSIWKKHHRCVHIYTSNININDMDNIKQVSKALTQVLFLTIEQTIRLIPNTGCSDTVFGFKKYFVEGYLTKLKTCPEIKGIAGSYKYTHRGIIVIEVVDKEGENIPINTTEVYFPSLQCRLFIPQIYLK